MNKTKENYKYRFLLGFFTATCCIAASYATYFLTNNGVADYEAGIIIALANILATIFAPVLGRIADKSKNWSSKRLVVLIIALQIVISALIYLIDNSLIISILYCILVMNVYLAQPIISAISFEYKKNNIVIDFGIARGFGSLFFALTSFALGKYTALWGSGIVPIASVIINIVILILAINILPNEPVFGKVNKQVEKIDNNAIKGGAFIKKYPLFFVMILGITLVMFFHNMTNIFFIRIVEAVGCGSNEMGIAVGISAILEIPTMFLFTRINKRIKTSTLLIISGLSFLLKGILFYAAGDVWVIYIAQCLNLTAFGLIGSARVYYSHEIVEKQDEVTGQAFMNATDTVSSVLGSFIGGFLMSFSGGIKTVLIAGIVICFVGVLIIFGVSVFRKKTHIQDR